MKRDFIEFFHGHIATSYCLLLFVLLLGSLHGKYTKVCQLLYLTIIKDLTSNDNDYLLTLYIYSEEHFTSFLDERVHLMLPAGWIRYH